MVKILLGGSPCTNWSISQRKNRETEPQGIGWELFKNYLIAKEKFEPDFFLYENNKSAAEPIKAQIRKELGVTVPSLFEQDNGVRFTYINSALVSAQNRQRFYVTNFGDIKQPEDRGILLRDILETTALTDVEKGYCLTHIQGNTRDHFKKHHTNIAFEPVCVAEPGRIKNGEYQQQFEPRIDSKTNALTTVRKDNQICEPVRIGTMPNGNGDCVDSQGTRIYSQDGKSRTLCANGGGWGAKTGLYTIPVEFDDDIPVKVISCADGKEYPVYQVLNGQITIKDKQYPIKLSDGFYIIRKLTPIECERLQTLTSTEKSVIIDLQNNITEVSRCLENLFIPVQCAEEKCRRLQSYVYSAQREQDQQETVLFAERYMSISLLQTDGLVQLNVHINLEDWSNQKDFLKESLKLARTAGKNTNYHGVGKIESFVHAVVGICMLPEQTVQAGKVGLPKNGSHFAQQENGNLRCMMFGIEITQPAKNAEKNIKMETELLKYITSDHLSTKLTEQKLKTLYCYAINVITGYIQEKTSGKSLSKINFNTVQGYTHGVAACNRYRGLGNGWTAEVIIHLLQHAKIPLDEEIVVLSMYDGIGTGRYCLDKMGYKNVTYYAYEIDKYAMQVAKSNYPDIIEMGDAFAVRQDDWKL